MGHRLTPTEQAKEHSLSDLIETLRDTFLFVHADREKGSDVIGDMIAVFLRIKKSCAERPTGASEAAEFDRKIEHVSKLRDNAAFVTIVDDEDDEDQCINFNLVPGEDIIIGYADRKHEDVASKITERVAEAIGYRITLL